MGVIEIYSSFLFRYWNLNVYNKANENKMLGDTRKSDNFFLLVLLDFWLVEKIERYINFDLNLDEFLCEVTDEKWVS